MWETRMRPSSFLLFLFLLHLSPHFSILPALPVQPDPAPVQPFVLPSPGRAGTPPSTIPAFPEQSDVALTCPLDLPEELFQGVSRACPSSSSSSSSSPPSLSGCCPRLAAWLYSAYATTALAAAARQPTPSNHSSSEMPLLPDDSETCVDGVEKALRARGLALAPLNDTCDVAYCYCGVRLRPFTCPGGLAVQRDAANRRWIAVGEAARRIERDCSLPGIAGCNRCLQSLYQLGGEAAHGGGGGGGGRGAKLGGRDRDCQLLGLTWLLARNRTLYLPAATRVLRALILTPGTARPRSCALAPDGMPLAVDSADLDDPSSSSSIPLPPRRLAAGSLLFIFLWWSSPLLLRWLQSSSSSSFHC